MVLLKDSCGPFCILAVGLPGYVVVNWKKNAAGLDRPLA